MTDNFIQIKNDNVKRLQIVDKEGKPTGEYLQFQIDDIELPLIYQEIQEQVKKNKQWYRNQMLIIKKRPDIKGKKMMSKNEEDVFKAVKEYYAKQEKTYDLFLGQGGVRKLLAGRKMAWETFEEIDEIINKQIIPFVQTDARNIVDRIIEKYGSTNDEEVMK